jgi:hypothetical protein
VASEPHTSGLAKIIPSLSVAGTQIVCIVQIKTGAIVADQSRVRANLKLHGISWESREWLVRRYQNNLCGICMREIEPAKSCIDHSHECNSISQHRSAGYGCLSCIRGGTCRGCNVWLSLTEKFPHLQSEHIKQYLLRRPFLGK